MLITRQVRCLLCAPQVRTIKYNKDLLIELRTKTGEDAYNCKLALKACRNDPKRAEEWLRDVAAHRAAVERSNSGLIAISSDKKSATMVDVKCESSLIAANHSFKNFVSRIASLCFTIAKEQNQFENSIAKIHLDSSQLNNLCTARGTKLKDETATLISQIGRSVLLRRAVCLQVKDELLVSGCTTNPVNPLMSRTVASMGFSGCLLIYKSTSKDTRVPVIAQQLCSHIIGMKPRKIGNVDVDKPEENELEESCMIYQEFLVEPDLRVIDVLQSYGISLVEFTLYECGENTEVDENDYQPQKDIVGV